MKNNQSKEGMKNENRHSLHRASSSAKGKATNSNGHNLLSESHYFLSDCLWLRPEHPNLIMRAFSAYMTTTRARHTYCDVGMLRNDFRLAGFKWIFAYLHAVKKQNWRWDCELRTATWFPSNTVSMQRQQQRQVVCRSFLLLDRDLDWRRRAAIKCVVDLFSCVVCGVGWS